MPMQCNYYVMYTYCMDGSWLIHLATVCGSPFSPDHVICWNSSLSFVWHNVIRDLTSAQSVDIDVATEPPLSTTAGNCQLTR